MMSFEREGVRSIRSQIKQSPPFPETSTQQGISSASPRTTALNQGCSQLPAVRLQGWAQEQSCASPQGLVGARPSPVPGCHLGIRSTRQGPWAFGGPCPLINLKDLTVTLPSSHLTNSAHQLEPLRWMGERDQWGAGRPPPHASLQRPELPASHRPRESPGPRALLAAWGWFRSSKRKSKDCTRSPVPSGTPEAIARLQGHGTEALASGVRCPVILGPPLLARNAGLRRPWCQGRGLWSEPGRVLCLGQPLPAIAPQCSDIGRLWQWLGWAWLDQDGGVRVTGTAGPCVARGALYFPGPLGTRTASGPETRKDGEGSLSPR